MVSSYGCACFKPDSGIDGHGPRFACNFRCLVASRIKDTAVQPSLVTLKDSRGSARTTLRQLVYLTEGDMFRLHNSSISRAICMSRSSSYMNQLHGCFQQPTRSGFDSGVSIAKYLGNQDIFLFPLHICIMVSICRVPCFGQQLDVEIRG